MLLRADHPLRGRIRSRASLRALEFILVKSHVEPAKALHRLGLEARIVGISGFTVRPPRARQEKPRVSAFTSA